jgi:alpha-methylacyl-CoA racemase
MAVGAIEPQFFAALVAGVGWTPPTGYNHLDRTGWPDLRSRLAEAFLTRTRDEWAVTFAGTDACVSPVLSFAEAAADEHIAARQALIELEGITQPAPAPRFSRTPAGVPTPAPEPGAHTDVILAEWPADPAGNQ